MIHQTIPAQFLPIQTRRSWMKTAALTLGCLALSRVTPSWAQAATAKRLITRTETPFNAEPSAEALLHDWLTPWEAFYVRSHGAVPQINLDAYRLKIEGLVERPREYRVAELASMFPAVSAVATLTCAGNRRAEFAAAHQQKVPGVSWDIGAIGNAEWSGVRLSDVLKAAGVKAEAKHVWFEGLDGIEFQGASQPFGGSIPLAQVMADSIAAPGAIVCSKMNGQPLTAEHGAPLRTLVPGFIGARSVKWLSRIVVSDQPSTNRFLAREYKLLREGTDAEIAATPPVYEMVLNSAIASAQVDGERLKLRGFALPQGQLGRVIDRVELTTDGGKSWTPAKIESPVRDFCWVLWSAELPRGAVMGTVAVRTVDNRGEAQPMTVPWNVKGYQYNAWHQWTAPKA